MVLEPQLQAIPHLEQFMKPEQHFQPITLEDCLVTSLAESRAMLGRLSLTGEVIATPGHSDDSVTLCLDVGVAFTGDLPPPHMAPDERGTVARSWEAIRACGVHTVYPGHGPSFKL